MPHGLPSAGDADLDLATRAREMIEAGDGGTAWLLAERLARRRRNLVADDAVLKALAMGALRKPDLAWSDIRAAAEIDPTHPAVNRLLLRGPDAQEREQAARRLIGPDPAATAQSGALTVLGGCGLNVVARLRLEDGRLRGWIVWRGSRRLSCVLRFADGEAAHVIEARHGARIPGFDHYAEVALPWPKAAEWVALESEYPRSAFLPDRFWRNTDPPEIATRTPPSDKRRAVAVIVPVYDDLDATRTCLDSLLAQPDDAIARRIVAIDDATPDPRIAALLDDLQGAGRITCIRNPINMGFAASVNLGLATLGGGEDALLLNADTVLPTQVCSRLAQAAHRRTSIGTVTPLSNNGEYTSFPVRFRGNRLPSRDALAEWDRWASEAETVAPVSMPNGIGFCLYVKHAVLEAVGGLSLRFDRGYGEDIEFCLRARGAGFDHVCAPDIVVGHAGARSFKSSKRALVVANLAEVDRLHPDYRRSSAAFVRDDPLGAVFSRLEWTALQDSSAPLACLIVPGAPADGLAARYAEDQAACGRETIVATVGQRPDTIALSLRRHGGGAPQNVTLTYDIDGAASALARDLKRFPVARLAVLDPANLPRTLATAGSQLTIADVILADAPAFLTSGGRQAGKSWNSVLVRAERILAAGPRLAAFLGDALPDLAPKMSVLRERRSPFVPSLSETPARHATLVYCDADDLHAGQLISAFASRVRKSEPSARIVLDGGHCREKELMQPGNVVLLGPGEREDLEPLRRMTFGMVLFLSPKGSLGDMRVDAVMNAGLPVGYVDPTLQRSAVSGGIIRLSPREKPALAAASLFKWREAILHGRRENNAARRAGRPGPELAAQI